MSEIDDGYGTGGNRTEAENETSVHTFYVRIDGYSLSADVIDGRTEEIELEEIDTGPVSAIPYDTLHQLMVVLNGFCVDQQMKKQRSMMASPVPGMRNFPQQY